MDWFERLTGFGEQSYEATRAQLDVDGEYLRSKINSRSYRIGRLELPSLAELRRRLSSEAQPGELRFRELHGDVRELHRSSANKGAMFQVASQFNLLEMVGPGVCPEDGVTRYEVDHTQGPACAISAGAATLFRNYFVPIGNRRGQTSARQLDALADVREMLAAEIGVPAPELWAMRNGYPIASQKPVERVGEWIRSAAEDKLDNLRSNLRIGVHWDVEVTDQPQAPGCLVSQAFCSAIPVSYSRIPAAAWEPLAKLVLEGAYEATFCAAALNAARDASKRLYLTRIGGGAFGNPADWIDAALDRALELFSDYSLEAVMVQYRGS